MSESLFCFGRWKGNQLDNYQIRSHFWWCYQHSILRERNNRKFQSFRGKKDLERCYTFMHLNWNVVLRYFNHSSLINSIPFLSDGVRCIAFKPDDEGIFLIGTDQGLVYKCTTEYNSKFLHTYRAHDTPVYNIVWNTFVSSIFMTCAAEWHLKIWVDASE